MRESRHRHWSEFVRDCEDKHRAYVIVTVLGAQGSTPRDSGTKMVIDADATRYGSVGGGHLEFAATQKAAELLAAGEDAQHVENFPLGEKLGQCCGGSASLLFECFVPTAAGLYVFGAGHVGRALIPIVAQLPFRTHWVDSRSSEFPDEIAPGVLTHCMEEPVDIVSQANPGGFFLIMTHNHALDFDLLSAILRRGDAAYVGVIGSASKWRRFQLRLQHRDFDQESIDSVACPVGLSSVPGKRPIEVAVSISAQLIAVQHTMRASNEPSKALRWKNLRETLDLA
ncbi:MAG: xanthine dehydrogenase accessory protein XdhC [Congregibacter sp.]